MNLCLTSLKIKCLSNIAESQFMIRYTNWYTNRFQTNGCLINVEWWPENILNNLQSMVNITGITWAGIIFLQKHTDFLCYAEYAEDTWLGRNWIYAIQEVYIKPIVSCMLILNWTKEACMYLHTINTLGLIVA